MQMKPEQLEIIKEQFKTLKDRSAFYARKFKDIDLSDVQTQEDFEKLPFSEKADLREAYPLGLQAVPDEKIIRIHSSSGTTGTPVVIPYTQKDVDDWATMFARCYETAGITNTDRIQITPGYGLWTAGIGFQLGAEHLGAMAIPMGPGNTEKQLRMMQDLKSTVLCATSSYALLLAEEIAEVRAASASGDDAAVEEELGDLLLTVTSLARKLGVKSEEALMHATDKFIDRFERVENAVRARGQNMADLSMTELNAVWDGIKHAPEEAQA